MSKPLEGIKVVDLSTYIAAPSTAKMLCDMGAEVIKVETFSGDGQRVEVTRFPDYDKGFRPFFDVYNAGKRSICIDIKNEAGRAALMKLILSWSEKARAAASSGSDLDSIVSMPVRELIGRAKSSKNFEKDYAEIEARMEKEFGEIASAE